MDSRIVELVNSVPIIIISEKDNGDNRRYHKKKRIREKWRKMYGTVSTALEAGQVISMAEPNPCLYMSRKTYSRLKGDINRGGQHGNCETDK
jgi:hypothetical protein